MPRTPYARRSAPLPIEDHRLGPSALLRVFRIHQRLSGGRPVTAVSLAQELEVSDRTIKRDIESMRHHYGAPIGWDPSSQTYTYESDFEFLPLVRLAADEALALELAGATFGAWRGTPLGAALLSALEKIAYVVAGAVSVPAVDVAADERRWFAITLEAVKRRHELRISYLKPRAQEPETRIVHPLHLAYLDHRWTLIAHDPARRGLRNFVLGRFREAHVTAHHFAPPAGFDPKTYLSGSMGRFVSDAVFEVRVPFDAIVAPYIRERPWHRTQSLVEQSGGALVASYRLNNLVDIQRRILACGSHAEVLAPAELRETIRAEAAAMLEIHEKPPAAGTPGHPVAQPP